MDEAIAAILHSELERLFLQIVTMFFFDYLPTLVCPSCCLVLLFFAHNLLLKAFSCPCQCTAIKQDLSFVLQQPASARSADPPIVALT